MLLHLSQEDIDPHAQPQGGQGLTSSGGNGSKRRKLERQNSELHRAVVTEIENPLAETVYLWFDGLANNMSDIHLKWVGNFRSFIAGLGSQPLRMGTMYTGCDIIRSCMEVLAKFWSSMYNTTVSIEHIFMCECDERKQDFLIGQFSPPILFTDAAELGNLSAFCRIAGEQVPVPHVDVLAA